MSKKPQSNYPQADIQNKELLDLKNLFSIALKAARIGIHDYDIVANSINWDERIREIWGTDINEPITYETFISGVHPEDRASVQEELNKALDPKIGEFFLEYRVINRKDKAVRWVHATGQTFFQDDRPIRLIGTVEDISDRKKVEEELKESEQLYKTIFDNGDDGFVLVEPIYDGNNSAIDILFLQLNFAYEQQTGTQASKVQGKRAKEVAPNLEQEWISLCGEVAKTGKTRRIESYNQRTNKWYDATYIPFTKGRVGILFRDVTERKNMEKQLKNSERLAAIGETAGMVGHDIRNPLQAIVGDVYLLKDFLVSMPEMPTKRDVAESLEEIEKNISYINKIVADLQDYSKTIRPEYCNVNLYDLIISIFRPIAIPDDVNPLIEVDPTIILRTDSALFTRIITNLVINAIQAMPKGGKLVIQALKNGGKIVLSVEDTGVGIPEEIKPKLFKPMVTTKSKGQGLGLAVVKRLVEALNGTICFESWEGKGTKFIMELPIQP